MIRFGLAAMMVAATACGAQANDVQDPKPADSVDVPPNTITDGDPSLRPPKDGPNPDGTGTPSTPPPPKEPKEEPKPPPPPPPPPAP